MSPENLCKVAVFENPTIDIFLSSISAKVCHNLVHKYHNIFDFDALDKAAVKEMFQLSPTGGL